MLYLGHCIYIIVESVDVFVSYGSGEWCTKTSTKMVRKVVLYGVFTKCVVRK